ncbi:Legionaminic acid biosynthesis protein PtmG [Olavius algarvensis associated proteobacterium Delta 3]|nr:Legionaminic acid biosynthesis protein PtmG [Olavius algarvensis associated proteobacterium Delta 3]CAB5114083.1 Legionaminic acid biosynthesis protein PtmG [Olavius algarvensis associated proteobacterium Delta 3]
MPQQHETYYGLPEQVAFCSKCVYSNQRPTSAVEFKHRPDSKKTTLHFDEEGVCDACRTAELKDEIDWGGREKELLKLLDRHRRDDGQYDCIVPGSGGKDSFYAAHVLKYKYGMHPLTVTWPPIMYTEYGHSNFRNWVEKGGFDNISFNQNGRVMKLLTRLSIENLFHPFQTFIIGQKNIAPKVAVKYGIPLIFYGENEAEWGNPIADNISSLRDQAFYTMKSLDEIYLGGVSIKELVERYDIPLADLMAYLPVHREELEKSRIEVHYLGYYLKWTPQESYYYAVEHSNFKARPFRTEGTFNKYASIDDKADDLNYYTYFIKFGIGRTTEDASQEIRNKHLTREEGCALVKRFDGEFPERYFNELMDHIGMTRERFMELCDQFRSPHLWAKMDGEWKLRHTVNNDGVDDR